MAPPQKNAPAHHHARVRRQHSNELAQDYVEAIHDIEAEGREARVTDLQEIFGVSHVSVIRALKRFEERGLLSRPESGGISLTSRGSKLAEESAGRHELVVRFLEGLGVSPQQAEADAEGIEHHISRETLEAFDRFLDSRRA